MYIFDSRKSFSEYDPRLVAPTCLYLASKAEESTVQAKLLVFYMKKIRMNFTSLFTRKLVSNHWLFCPRKYWQCFAFTELDLFVSVVSQCRKLHLVGVLLSSRASTKKPL
jgi:hypothetical protein